ncbi:MAG: ABC transporter ATP-binding protein [Cyanobacteria bacterium P01_F01_bin.42]
MIEVEHLSKTYGSTTAIEDVTFNVEKGEILGLLGPNGAGKTTTMRILAGYLPATEGSARVGGHEVHEDPMAVRQCIGYLPEHPPLYPEMTTEGYLHFVARIKGVAAGDRQRCVDSAISQCGLSEHHKTLIHKLSKGYRQRVGIAQAIVHEPDAIIFDEPTVGLDPRQIIEVRKLIQSLAGDRTVILSSHILPEVRMTCSRIAIIHQGKVVAVDSPTRLVNQMADVPQYELELKGNGEALESKLLDLDMITQVEPILSRTLQEHHYRFKIQLENHPDAAPGVTQTLVNLGFELHEFRKVRATLEEVFLNLTMEADAIDDTTHREPLTNAAVEAQS